MKLRMVYLFGSANMPVLIAKVISSFANNFLLTHVGFMIENPFMQPTLQIGVQIGLYKTLSIFDAVQKNYDST